MPVRLDVFDPAAVRNAVATAAPDVLLHQLTALSGGDVTANSRIRREGTANLVAAARATGVRRIVAQSIAWAYEPGDTPADETTPLDLAAPQPRASSVGGVRALEDAVAGVERHVILRYGVLYGPGTGTGGPAWARGASNTLARQKLAWTPTYPSWRTGFTSLS